MIDPPSLNGLGDRGSALSYWGLYQNELLTFAGVAGFFSYSNLKVNTGG